MDTSYLLVKHNPLLCAKIIVLKNFERKNPKQGAHSLSANIKAILKRAEETKHLFLNSITSKKSFCNCKQEVKQLIQVHVEELKDRFKVLYQTDPDQSTSLSGLLKDSLWKTYQERGDGASITGTVKLEY